MAWRLLMLAMLLGLAAAAPKHIIHIMADDLGHYNVGFRGNTEAHTPNIDRMARGGAILDRHYAFVYCSPSRSSFLSGRLPFHVNQLNKAVDMPNGTIHYAGIDERMTTIASKLSKAGYATHHVGKWHGGEVSTFMIPISKGFNSSFGFLGGGEDHWNETLGVFAGPAYNDVVDLWRDHVPAWGENGTWSAELFRNETLKIIQNHDASTPLFLYLALHDVHCPLEVPDQYQNQSIKDEARRIYHGMATAMDEVVGAVQAALEAKGMLESALIVFTSDNGGPAFGESSGCHGEQAGNNWPLKGGKVSAFEGGVRVNAIAYGGLLPQTQRGKVLDGYIHMADWYRTYCSLAGISQRDCDDSPAGLPGLDSLDMLPYLFGQNNTSPRTSMVLQYYTEAVVPATFGQLGDVAAIVGDYKLVLGTQYYSNLWSGPVYPNGSNTGWPNNVTWCAYATGGCLYNIKEDPTEHVNLWENPTPEIRRIYDNLVAYTRAQGLTAFQTSYIGPVTKCKTEKQVLLDNRNFVGPLCS